MSKHEPPVSHPIMRLLRRIERTVAANEGQSEALMAETDTFLEVARLFERLCAELNVLEGRAGTSPGHASLLAETIDLLHTPLGPAQQTLASWGVSQRADRAWEAELALLERRLTYGIAPLIAVFKAFADQLARPLLVWKFPAREVTSVAAARPPYTLGVGAVLAPSAVAADAA